MRDNNFITRDTLNILDRQYNADHRNKYKQLDVNVDCRTAAPANRNDDHPLMTPRYRNIRGLYCSYIEFILNLIIIKKEC